MSASQSVEVSAMERADRAVFRDLIEPHLGAGLSFAFALLGDRADAEDAAQDAALIAWRKLHALRSHTSSQTWFLGIVANVCRNRRRWSRRFLAAIPLEFPAGASRHPEASLDLRAALYRLPRRELEVVSLHYYVGLPLPAVAATLDIPVGTAKSRLGRALGRLRSALDTHPALASS